MRLYRFILPLLLVGTALAASRDVKMYTDKLDYDENRLKVRLLGHVKIVSKDMTMTSPYAEYFTDRQIGQFEGGVKITGPGTSLVGRQMKVFYGEQRAEMKGSVRLVTEKVAGAEPGTPTTMVCDQLDYQWLLGLAKAKGSVKVRQGQRRAFADRADYHKNEQYVQLLGNVRVEQGDNDWLSCASAHMDLAKGTITAEGGVVARTRLNEPDKSASPEPKSQAKPTVVEPEFPLKPVEADPPIPLPGLDK